MRRRILLADDSVTIQKVIELTFLDEDYEVKAVSNGDEAIAALPQVNPDFVIADVHMPGANGYEVCRRSKEYRPEIPVLLLVGTFEPFDEGQSRAVGADSFLKKPFDSQELLQRVEELLAARSTAAPPSAPPADDLLAMPSLSELPPLDLGPSPLAEPAAPATGWGSFQVEPPHLPVPDPLPAPTAFPLGEDRSFEPRGESAFDDSPFVLDDEPLTAGAPAIEESSFQPAGEPLFDLDATATYPSEEPPPLPAPVFETFQESPSWVPSPPIEPPPAEPSSGSFQVSGGFETTPEERLGIPQGAAPLVESRAETEARIEAPPPPSVERSHEPESAAPAAVAPATAAPGPVNGDGRLSEEDVDRIARRVVELIADRAIRDVAWEVIPDMAEMVIRDRLRELESQAESFE
jgi:CheY-like chemotaxis protein